MECYPAKNPHRARRQLPVAVASLKRKHSTFYQDPVQAAADGRVFQLAGLPDPGIDRGEPTQERDTRLHISFWLTSLAHSWGSSRTKLLYLDHSGTSLYSPQLQVALNLPPHPRVGAYLKTRVLLHFELLRCRRQQLAAQSFVFQRLHLPAPNSRTFACHLAAYRQLPPSQVPLSIRPGTFKLPPSPYHPLVLVGPGTGVAPMRSVVLERRWRRERLRQPGGDGSEDMAVVVAAAPAPPDTLFFGCRCEGVCGDLMVTVVVVGGLW